MSVVLIEPIVKIHNLKGLGAELFKCFYSKKARLVTKLKSQSEKVQAKHFVDFKRVKVAGGNGGDGCSSMLSLWCKEFAGPDGGDGGNGGHVIFQADEGVNSLVKVYPIYQGKHGHRGMGNHRAGCNTPHTYVKVPVGTFFRDEAGTIIADLQTPQDFFIGARGGAGGKGNYFFLSNENRAPSTYEKGGVGEKNVFYAELRIKSDVGLIGFPSAGKSSILRCLTRATPQIGSYPFTTLFPHIGIMEFDDYQQISVADIPGLIEGASRNKGLGFSFLRHVEQCKSLIFVLDLSFPNTVSQYEALKTELNQYQTSMAEKQHIIVANKIDLEISSGNFERLSKDMKGSGIPVLPLSAKRKSYIELLVQRIRDMYDAIK